jgi:hypothetical protein
MRRRISILDIARAKVASPHADVTEVLLQVGIRRWMLDRCDRRPCTSAYTCVLQLNYAEWAASNSLHAQCSRREFESVLAAEGHQTSGGICVGITPKS